MKRTILPFARKTFAIGLSAAMLCGTAAFAESLGFVGQQIGILTVSAAGEETPLSSFEYSPYYEDDEFGEHGENIIITGFLGNETDIIIPSQIDGKPVKYISEFAFKNNTKISSITISDSVESIELGSEAFSGCTGLTSINVDENNKEYSSIDGVLFTKSQKGIVCYPPGKKGSYTVPEGVISLGDEFDGCNGITSISIPESVTELCYPLFNGCTELTSIEVDEKNTEYASENGVLYNKDKTILERCPAGIEGVFSIPEGVEFIGSLSFQSCTGITNINIPDSVERIGEYAFENCTKLTSISIPDSVDYIWSGAFESCSGLTSIRLPNGIKKIDSVMFLYCTGLTSVTIPDSVTEIRYGAFSFCKELTSVIIPDSVTSIDSDVFYDCNNLTIYGKKGSTAESHAKFYGINFVEYVNETPASSFNYEENDDGGITITGFKGAETDVVIPSEIDGKPVTSIGDYAFSGCTGLTSITIPNSVTSIGEYAFYGCGGLTIYGTSGSYVEQYAKDNQIEFVAITSVSPLCNTSTLNSERISLGSRITLTGSAEGGSGEYTYSYYYKRPTGKVWRAIGAEDTSATVAFFTPTSLGDLDVKVVAKDSEGTEAEKTFTVTVVDGKSTAFNNNSTINVTGAKPGTKIKLTGAADGDGTYTYAYYYKRVTAKQWTVIGTECTSTAAAQFTPKTEGEFNVKVDIMDENGEIVSRQFAVTISNDYSVDTPMKNRSTVDTETAPVNSRVTITGLATGGTGPYTYAYYYKKAAANSWVAIGEEFTSSKTASIKLRNVGDYIIKVCAKDTTGGMVSKNFDVTITG